LAFKIGIFVGIHSIQEFDNRVGGVVIGFQDWYLCRNSQPVDVASQQWTSCDWLSRLVSLSEFTAIAIWEILPKML